MVGSRSILCGLFSSFPLPPSLYFPLFISVTAAYLLCCMPGLMAGFSGFVSQWERPPSWSCMAANSGSSGTKPPLSDAVVKYSVCQYISGSS